MGIFSVNNSDKYDNKVITIKDRNGSEQKVSLSVFIEGMAIANDDVGVLSVFDKNKDKKIDKNEVELLKKAIIKYAGDEVLDDNEILSMFNLDANSNKAKSILNQFKIMVERQFKGSLSTETKTKNGDTIISNFNSDGSGTTIVQKQNGLTITRTYSKGKVLEKAVLTYADGTTMTEEYKNNEQGNPIKCTKKKNGLVTEEVEYKYDNTDRLIEQKNIIPGKKLQIGGQTVDTSKVTTTTHQYYGKTRTRKQTIINKPDRTVQTTDFNKDGKIVKNTINSSKIFVQKDANGKIINVTMRNSETVHEYIYTENGKTIVTQSTDINGYKSESTFYYDKQDKPISGNKIYYSRGAKIEDKYDGNNLSNRIKGKIPTERIEYEEGDDTKIKKITKFKFDQDGIVIGDEIFDANGNKIDEHDYTQLDGKFDTAYQVNRGDCYLLAAINALAATEDGTKLLNDSIRLEGDNYVISFPGAAIAKRELIQKLKAKDPNFDVSKINIPDKYTITKAELHEAMKKAGSKYSWGDKDVLLLEVAYEKFRTAVATNLAKNKIPTRDFIQNLSFDSNYTSQGDFLSGGHPSEVIFALTGRKSDKEFYTPKKEVEKMPACYIDSNYQMHVADVNGNISLPSSTTKSMQSEEYSRDKKLRDEIIDELIKDCADGKLDEYAATAGFKVSSQEVNGQVIPGGGHAFSIKNITADKVILGNPWNPEVDVVMSMEDFKKAVTKIQMVSLKTKTAQEPVQPPTAPHHEVPGNPVQPGSNNSNVENTSSPTQSSEISKKYTVKKNEGYTTIIKRELKSQGIATTSQNIKNAKAQFENLNPGAVHTYGANGIGKNKKFYGNKYLFADAEVNIPKFKTDNNGNVI